MSVFPSYDKPSMAEIRDALRTQDPSQARAQVEGMLRSGRLSQARFRELGEQASGILGALGMNRPSKH